jgi:hypothetical protein
LSTFGEASGAIAAVTTAVGLLVGSAAGLALAAEVLTAVCRSGAQPVASSTIKTRIKVLRLYLLSTTFLVIFACSE